METGVSSLFSSDDRSLSNSLRRRRFPLLLHYQLDRFGPVANDGRFEGSEAEARAGQILPPAAREVEEGARAAVRGAQAERGRTLLPRHPLQFDRTDSSSSSQVALEFAKNYPGRSCRPKLPMEVVQGV